MKIYFNNKKISEIPQRRIHLTYNNKKKIYKEK